MHSQDNIPETHVQHTFFIDSQFVHNLLAKINSPPVQFTLKFKRLQKVITL
jgi:hypothetical protein